MTDDDAWDRVIDFALRFGGAVALGLLVYLDFTILDIHWKKAMLAGAIVLTCVAGRLGVWTLRKLALLLTIYAIAYLVGMLPPPQSIGDFISRALA